CSNSSFKDDCFTPNNGAIFSGQSTTVVKKKPTPAASATAPSYFLAIPNATQIANKIPNCSKIVDPAIEKTSATVGHIPIAVKAFPIPTIIAAAGNTATGSIRDLPKR